MLNNNLYFCKFVYFFFLFFFLSSAVLTHIFMKTTYIFNLFEFLLVALAPPEAGIHFDCYYLCIICPVAVVLFF